jgi:hypothetical protein
VTGVILTESEEVYFLFIIVKRKKDREREREREKNDQKKNSPNCLLYLSYLHYNSKNDRIMLMFFLLHLSALILAHKALATATFFYYYFNLKKKLLEFVNPWCSTILVNIREGFNLVFSIERPT